jgi:hypothetical protein
MPRDAVLEKQELKKDKTVICSKVKLLTNGVMFLLTPARRETAVSTEGQEYIFQNRRGCIDGILAIKTTKKQPRKLKDHCPLIPLRSREMTIMA